MSSTGELNFTLKFSLRSTSTIALACPSDHPDILPSVETLLTKTPGGAEFICVVVRPTIWLPKVVIVLASMVLMCPVRAVDIWRWVQGIFGYITVTWRNNLTLGFNGMLTAGSTSEQDFLKFPRIVLAWLSLSVVKADTGASHCKTEGNLVEHREHVKQAEIRERLRFCSGFYSN